MNSIRRLAGVCLPGSLVLSGLLILGLLFFSAVPGNAQQLTGTISATSRCIAILVCSSWISAACNAIAPS